jgi:hypothetical protein
MALIKLAAGMEFDIASGEELKDATTGILGALDRDEPRPFYLSRTDTDVSSGGIVQIDLGAPPVGSIWQLRYITLFGNDDSTVIGGVSAALYCGTPSNLTLAQLKVPGLAIPSLTFIPDTCIWCHPSENLVIKTSTVVTAGQQIGATVGIEEWRQRDVSRLGGKP